MIDFIVDNLEKPPYCSWLEMFSFLISQSYSFPSKHSIGYILQISFILNLWLIFNF